jgi:hypothetical protein
MSPTITIFAGPSVPPDQRTHPGVRFCPPARHGDLWRLQPRRGDVIVVVDGVYQLYAPLRHQEIRWAIGQGALVAGAASYGALRAAELRHHGMVPLGSVASAYVDGSLTGDADVAVLHTDDDECRSLTIPFVSILFATRDLHSDGVIGASDCGHVVDVARRLHFTERSTTALRARSEPTFMPAMNRVLAHLAQGGDVKRNDAAVAIGWAVHAAGSAESAGAEAAGDPPRHSSYTVEERFEVSPVWTGTDISARHVLAALQLFAADFPDRHRRYVERICGVRDGGPDALSVLRAAGFVSDGPLHGPYATPTHATRHWPQATRVLVRTFRLSPGRLTYTSLTPEVMAGHDLNGVTQWCEATRNTQPARRGECLDALRGLWSAHRTGELRLACLERGFRNIDDALRLSARFDFAAAAGHPL